MAQLRDMNWLHRNKNERKEFPSENRCSFCSTAGSAAIKLVDGPDGVHICNDCVEVCEEILRYYEEHPQEWSRTRVEEKSRNKPYKPILFKGEMIGYRCSFCLKPEEEVNHLIEGPTVCICDACARRFREDIGSI